MMVEERDRNYRQLFNAFVVRLCKKLTGPDCEDLYHIYKDTTSLPPILLRTADNNQIEPIKLFRRLEEQRVFSHLNPKNLVDMFEMIQRSDLCEDVKEFIEKYGSVIMETDAMYVTTRPLNPGKMSERTNLEQASTDSLETDGPYYQTVAKPAPQAAIKPVDTAENGYCSFYPTNLPLLPPLPPIPTAVGTEAAIQQTGHSFYLPLQSTRKYPNTDTSAEEVYSYIDMEVRRLYLNSMFREPSFPSTAASMSPLSNESRNSLGVSSSSVSRWDSDPGDTASNWSNEPIYEYPEEFTSINSADILKKFTHPGPLLVVDEKMRLLVKPIRDMIQSSQHRVISSQPIAARHHRFCNVTFELQVSTAPRVDGTSRDLEHSQMYVMAELYLHQGARGLEDTFPLQAHLSVKQPRSSSKRNKQKQVSSKDDLVKPIKDKTRQVQYLHEQRILLDLPSHSSFGSQKMMQHVASFTNIISHRNFMDNKVVSTPFLDLKLVVTEFNSQFS